MRIIFLAASYICAHDNVLASTATSQGVITVILAGNDVTPDVQVNSQGIDVNSGTPVEIQFSYDQVIDSVVVFSDSNVESYYISYETSDGNEQILGLVNRVFIKLLIHLIVLIRKKNNPKRNSIKSQLKRLPLKHNLNQNHLVIYV